MSGIHAQEILGNFGRVDCVTAIYFSFLINASEFMGKMEVGNNENRTI